MCCFRLVVGLVAVAAATLGQPAAAQPDSSYVTLAYGEHEGSGIIKGVMALLQSLRSTHTAYGLTVMVAEIDARTVAPLVRLGCVHIRDGLSTAQPGFCLLSPTLPLHYDIPQTSFLDAELQTNFHSALTKLRAWQLPFVRAVFLDSDTLVLANCDHMFGFPQLSGVLDNDQARRDGYLNAGVFVLRPSNSTFAAMVSQLATRTDRYHYPDQDFLNEFFANNKSALPAAYNAQLGHGRAPVDAVYVMHFIAHPKPWQYITDEEIARHRGDDEGLRLNFSRALAHSKTDSLAYYLVADGSQGFPVVPAAYLGEAYALWFAALLGAASTLASPTAVPQLHRFLRGGLGGDDDGE